MGFDPTGLGEECDARKSKRSSTRSDQVNVLRSFTLSASVAGRLKKKTCVTCFDFRAWLFLFMFCCMFVTCKADMNTHTTSNNSRRHVLICAVAQSGACLLAHFLRACFVLSAGSVRRAGRKTSDRMPKYPVELSPGNRYWQCPDCKWFQDAGVLGCQNPSCSYSRWLGSGRKIADVALVECRSAPVGPKASGSAPAGQELVLPLTKNVLVDIPDEGEDDASLLHIPVPYGPGDTARLVPSPMS